MTIYFKNSYLKETSLVVGPFVKDGPLKNFDKIYNDFYDSEKTFEDCEIKELKECFDILLNKNSKNIENIDLVISSDLTNQLAISNVVMSKFDVPYFGVYNACASLCEMINLASCMIDTGSVKNIALLTSSHNLTAERQYRNPVEYGAPKPNYSTFTVTSQTGVIVSNEKDIIKVESSTIGKVMDAGIKDTNDMGGVMAIAAVDTLLKHLKDTKRDPSYYDIILTGDLGIYGKQIFLDTLDELFDIKLDNYNDTACMVYNLEDEKVDAGGSGISCMPTVLYSEIIPLMKKGKMKKILLIATGALMNPTIVNQKKTIPSIAHAVSLEANI